MPTIRCRVERCSMNKVVKLNDEDPGVRVCTRSRIDISPDGVCLSAVRADGSTIKNKE